MARGNAPGFPLDGKAFDGGGNITPGGSVEGKDLKTVLSALETWIKLRGVVNAPGDLPTSGMEDGDLYAVKEAAGPGTVPALYIYDADTTTWKNVTNTGLPGNHATTHITGADPVAVTAPANDSIPMTPAAPAPAVLDVGWLPVGAGATDVCAGNDARLSDARAPTAHTHPNADLSEATATPTPSRTVISDAVGVGGIDTWGAAPTGAVGVVWVAAAPTTIRDAIDRIAAAVAGLLAAPIP